MDPLWEGLRAAGQAYLDLLTLPYFYLAIVLTWWHAARETALQRKMFHVRLYGALSITLKRLGAGVLVGVALSVASLATGAELTPGTLVCVWAATLLLTLFRLRYICLAYAAGALGMLQAALSAVEDGSGPEWIGHIIRAIDQIDVAGLLLVAGLLHVAEGLLVRLQGARTAVPLFLEGKRGKPVGAYALSGVWPIPLVWLVPAAGTSGFALPWTPWFGGGADALLWSLLAFPVLIGFSERTTTYWPEQKARMSGYLLMVYGAVIALLAAGSVYWAPLAIVASVLVFALHEGLVWISRFREAGRQPLYAQDGSGVRILAVLPGSPAMEMGLMAGETILKVNGRATRTKEELYAALQRQSAFSKMEVVNREGHVKFLQRARYAGEHYQLGLILAPDDAAEFVAAPRAASLWRSLRDAGARRREDAAAALAFASAESGAATGEQAAAGDAASTGGAGDGAAAETAEEGSAAAAGAAPDSANAMHAGSGTASDPRAAEGKSAGISLSAPAPEDPGLPPRRARR